LFFIGWFVVLTCDKQMLASATHQHGHLISSSLKCTHYILLLNLFEHRQFSENATQIIKSCETPTFKIVQMYQLSRPRSTSGSNSICRGYFTLQ